MNANEPVSSGLRELERAHALVDYLKKERFPSRLDMARTLEVSTRTVQRTLDFLRDRFQCPLAYSHEHRGYHLTDSAWFLPRVMVTEGELFSLLIARQAMAQYRGTPVENSLRKIFEKIADDLSERISVHPDHTDATHLSFAPLPVLDVREEVWNTLLAAIREQRVVHIQYHSHRSAKTRGRNVDPHHILNMRGDWYLFARDHDRKRICQFQLHRVQDAQKLERRFERDPSFNAAEIIRSSFGNFASQEDLVTLRLQIGGDMARLLADRQFHPQQRVKPRADGFEISFPISAAGDRPFYDILQWILSMGRDADILAPPALKTRYQEEVKAMVRKLSH
ncbi:MAG: WYL domain-containing protein [Verrucomicrobia bacterium]|nr:WYL domain-containing protein [Verrucomicrobiota bacterium]